ncbi:MAG: alpha-glucosidase/alpha-galactosidase [Brevinema sp.]
MKITFIGAGSTVFVRNILGDCMSTPALNHAEIALYDIDPIRLKESEQILKVINQNINQGKSTITSYCGIENRKNALKNANFVVNAIQVGGYDPCTIIDFEIPKKYGLPQTIADTLGIGGIFRSLRTIPVMDDFAKDMEEVCPSALLLNYTNPMATLTGYMLRYTGINTVGLCHSVQTCSHDLLTGLGMEDKLAGRTEYIAGINHMGWLLEIRDKDGKDLYPEIKKRAYDKNQQALADPSKKHPDMVRYEYINYLGYYCTESSEHNAEYNSFFIKSKYPDLVEKYNIPIDEYITRCIKQIEEWKEMSQRLLSDPHLSHTRTYEYGSYIMESIVNNRPYKIGGNVLNTGGLISNLPKEACVEVPCMVDGSGINPCYVGELPVQLAAMNMTNINVQLLIIEAAKTLKKEHIYQAAMLDPHTSSELSIDDIVRMCDELLEAHHAWMPKYR